MIFEHRIWPDQPVNVSLPDDFGLDVISSMFLICWLNYILSMFSDNQNPAG